MAAVEINRAALLLEAGSNVVIQDRKIPTPTGGEILVKNRAIAINPIDWKRQAWGFMVPSYPVVLGSDVCGIVEAVGPDVEGFAVGDKVIGYADSMRSGDNDRAAFQAYSIIRSTATSRLPASLSFEEGATLPMGLATAAMALFHYMELPKPPATGAARSSPGGAILIWGGSSSVGSMAVQLAKQAGLKVVATASAQNHDYVRSLGADAVVDYRSETAVDDILRAAGSLGSTITYCLDAISLPATWAAVSEVLSQAGGPAKLAHLLPPPSEGYSKAENIALFQVYGAGIFEECKDLCIWTFNEYLAGALERKALVVSPKPRVVAGGLDSIQKAMDELKAGVSNEKIVVTLE